SDLDLNKSTVQTLELMRGFGRFAEFDLPLLAALSRKDFVGESLGLAKAERLEGPLAAAAWAVQHGARMLRVHDVRATVRLVRMREVLAGGREPVGALVHTARARARPAAPVGGAGERRWRWCAACRCDQRGARFVGAEGTPGPRRRGNPGSSVPRDSLSTASVLADPQIS